MLSDWGKTNQSTRQPKHPKNPKEKVCQKSSNATNEEGEVWGGSKRYLKNNKIFNSLIQQLRHKDAQMIL